MKKKTFTKISSFQDEEFEKLLAEKDAELKVLARRIGKTLAERKLPNATGDKLISYLGEIKAGYEKLCAFVYKRMQPATHFPEVNTDANNLEAEKKKAFEEIYKLDKEIENLNSAIDDLNVAGIYHNVRDVRIKTLFFYIAELFFNTISFQVLGDNLLISFLISVPVTLTISEYAHLVAMQFRKIQNKIKRRVFMFCALLLVISLFVVLGYFRSIGLGKEGFSLATVCFVIINIFIFLVAVFMHFKYSLTKEEKIKYHSHKKLKVEIDKKRAEISQIEQHIADMEVELNEKAILAMQLAHYTENTIKEISKSYEESVAILESNNIRLRSDRKVPECFSNPIPALDIQYDFQIYKPELEKKQ